eukprot:TRINITY_DN1781_c0_g1_i3.p1 TRINITY_DN1781_c0_g1~~TRINITY_DN1781_c0_g1_i3.p1  ORF type:complete len:229 (+),score=39.11 TRINITY_DN1781_c0_g1_i3:237-923(+)
MSFNDAAFSPPSKGGGGGGGVDDFFPSSYGNNGDAPAGVSASPLGIDGSAGNQYADQPNYINSKVSIWTGSYEDEEPLLEELGINFSHIRSKTVTVLHPTKKVDPHLMDDTDLAGPIVFCLLLGGFMLLTGKLHFGYIYGFGGLGCIALYLLLNLMSDSGVSAYQAVSVMGYCLLPMVLLAGAAIVFPLNGLIGYILAICVVLWCSHSASLIFVTVLCMKDQQVCVVG